MIKTPFEPLAIQRKKQPFWGSEPATTSPQTERPSIFSDDRVCLLKYSKT